MDRPEIAREDLLDLKAIGRDLEGIVMGIVEDREGHLASLGIKEELHRNTSRHLGVLEEGRDLVVEVVVVLVLALPVPVFLK